MSTTDNDTNQNTYNNGASAFAPSGVLGAMGATGPTGPTGPSGQMGQAGSPGSSGISGIAVTPPNQTGGVIGYSYPANITVSHQSAYVWNLSNIVISSPYSQNYYQQYYSELELIVKETLLECNPNHTSDELKTALELAKRSIKRDIIELYRIEEDHRIAQSYDEDLMYDINGREV